jgi:hypothetical protein
VRAPRNMPVICSLGVPSRALCWTAGLVVWLGLTASACGNSPSNPTPTPTPPAPTVTGLDPVIGSADGGTRITITGTNFNNTDYVTVGDKQTVGFILNSDTSLTVIDPGGSPATVDVVVVNAGGSSVVSDASKFAWDHNELTEFSISTDVVKAGTPVPGKIAVKYPAPANGLTIPLRWSSTPAGSSSVVVPATIFLPPTLSSANFQVTTLFVSAPQQIRLEMEHGAVTRTVSFTLNP